ncbi:hypothetical protein [Desulfatiglans anilini]|uniref:hypothetical protein n=1 Tax=Desulfatiglans anilini TaxID=90728 RepID=UPI0004844808|nr:hypothetical protein [Desulfatiglans anilini]
MIQILPAHPVAIYRVFILFLCLPLALALASCKESAKPTVSLSPQEAVASRALEYWAHRINGDMEKAYAMEDPESLKGLKLGKYIQSVGSSVHWKSADVSHVKLLEDQKSAIAYMKIRYVYSFAKEDPDSSELESTLAERWLLRENQWLHQYRFPFGIQPDNGPEKPPGKQSEAPQDNN